MVEEPVQKRMEEVPALRDVRWFFFDLDGTLADSVTGLQGSIEAAFVAVGRRLPVADLRAWIGPGIRTILRNVDGSLVDAELDAMERVFRADYDGEGVLRTEMFAGVVPLLQGLKRDGRRLFVVTNKPKLATGRLLAARELSSLFEDVVSRDSRDPAYASKGEMLQETARRHGADVAASVMVGDTEEDAAAAVHAGMRFVHAAYGYGTYADAGGLRLMCAGDLVGMCGLAVGVGGSGLQENEG